MSTLTLTLRQPAQLGDRARDDFVLSTMRHLPGTAVRGAFAAAWIARYGAPEPGRPGRAQFLRLFEGGVRFGALLAPRTEFDPLSVFRHKYPAAGCELASYDEAADAAADAATRDGASPLECAQCGSPYVQGKGLWGAAEDKPKVRRRVSVAIDDEHEVARVGQLFTREAIRQGHEFRGTLIAEDPADLDRLRELGPVRVGGRRTTHGLAAIAIDDNGPPPPGPQRLSDTRLVLRLRAPGIFTDPCGRPRPEPSPEELTMALGVPARVRRRWTRWQEIGGWHVASGLPKPAELAVCAGSVFLIEAQRPAEPAALEALARRGVGLRRHEGFGDLAPPPDLRTGETARGAREQRQNVSQAVRSVQDRAEGRWPGQWRETRALLVKYARGDTAAARRLPGKVRGQFDDEVREAVSAFAALSPQDAADVARELGWL